ncbi:MAG: beta-glucanase (GH16 family) [Phenylobacterium sp.]|jgi:beta-glucanase (GH16 family)
MKHNFNLQFTSAQVRKSLTVAGAAGTLLLATSGALAASCQNPTPVWADEFDGSAIDTSKWDVMLGDGCSYGICGWGNSELQTYQADNLVVGNGSLKIIAKKQRVQGKQYTSGRIRTANMPNGGQWTNGRFEARIKLPNGAGMWPAFWMLPTDPVEGWPMSGEIDIVEATGQSDMFALGTLHYGQAWPDNEWTQGKLLKQPDAWSDGFHEYAVEWQANEIRWYVDDILYSTKTPSDMSDSAYWTFENYQYHMLLNLAVGGNMGGTVDDSQLPQTLEVDYVRIYDFGQPSLSGSHLVEANSQQSYAVVDEAGTSSAYSWTAPTGETSNAGALTVNWGTVGGQVTVSGSNSCGSYQLAMDVHVSPTLSLSTALDDFESQRNLTYTSFSGAFDQSVANPAVDSVNNSATVAKYIRDSGSQWDVIAADAGVIADLPAFVAGDRAFYLDVYTTAPAGTQILVQLENNNVATPSNYPSGRHSKYNAHTTSQSGWQRLKFQLEDLIDTTTADADVNSIIVLIDPDSTSGDTYYLDNFAIYGTDGGSGGDPATSMSVSSVATGTQSAGKGKKYGTGTITVVDNLGGAVAGATVSVVFSGSWNDTISGVTDANGTVTLVTSTALSGGVTVNACVDSVSGSLTFDSAGSTGLCQ